MLSTREVVELFSDDQPWRAVCQVRRHIRSARTRAEIRTLADAGSELARDPRLASRTLRVAVAGWYSTENLRDPLALQFFDRGLFCLQYHAPFGQLGQELRNPASGLYAANPEVVILVPHVSHYLSKEEAFSAGAAEGLVAAVAQEVRVLRERLDGPIAVLNFLPPESRAFGILDSKQDMGIADFYRYANLSLARRLATENGAFVIDVAHLASFAAVPWSSLHKPYYLAGCTLPDQLAMAVAGEIVAVGAALKGFARKCLVVDLDNTLWGGVVGEDGVAGIQVGGSFPGNVFADLQRQILALHNRGVILGINSKNNEADAWEVFESRPEMVLKREHFSSLRINWNDKAANLREMAEELNIGLDAIVVLDDRPAERDWMEMACPEVYAIPADDPLEMLRFLAVTRLFDTLAISAEDALRAKSYAAASARKRLQGQASDLNDFLRSLELVVDIGTPSDSMLGRFAQLTQKTNQFNLTTRRYSEEQVRHMLQEGSFELFYCACRDRFADEGVTGAAIIRKDQREWVIETFLLSCRVLGRGVERAFLAFICAQGFRARATRVLGEFIRTNKNAQTTTFYRDNGFSIVTETEERSLWELALPPPATMWPEWIQESHLPQHVTA